MARYIDADKLKERLLAISVVSDDLYGMGINRGLDRAETAIDMMPTADVVPKSEVADWIITANKKNEKIIELELELGSVKSEVAMEIIGEIKNLLLPLVYLGADGEWHMIKPYASKLHSFVEGLLDLLEKYTEEKE